MRHRILLLALAVSGVAGCLGTETGNPPLTPEVGWDSTIPMGIAPPVDVTSLRLSVARAALLGCDGVEDATLFVGGDLDLVARTGTAELAAVPEGTYCGLALSLAPTASVPHALRLDGERRSDLAQLHAVDATPLEVRLVGRVDVALDSPAWLLVVDRDLAVTGANVSPLPAIDGEIVLSSERNADRLPGLRASIASAITLRIDTDGDGTLDDDERALPPLASPE